MVMRIWNYLKLLFPPSTATELSDDDIEELEKNGRIW
jgi:hypothetical protein